MTEPTEGNPELPMRILKPAARSYKDAINALNSLQSNFASIEAMKKLGPNVNRNELSINEVHEYIRRLGYKTRDFDKLNLIHVTGTKGKGSTCAFTESILKQYKFNANDQNSNIKTNPINKLGLFTSPHLKTVRERIRINGNPINESKFTKYFFEVWDKLSSTTSSPDEFPSLQPCETVKPMYFKYLTILSFHVFLSEGVDTAIYEVGVGGTYDSTNIIQNPTVTGISSLGIDHTFMLGNTIDSITWNKTGIFKKNCPAVVSNQLEYPESLKIIEQRAKEIGVSSLDVVDEDLLPSSIKLGLAGKFQRQNASLAAKLASIHLSKLGVPQNELPDLESTDVDVLPDRFIEGLQNANWDGRCQIISNKPNFENIDWYIDGAHTLESIQVSSSWFKECMDDKLQSKLKKSGSSKIIPGRNDLKILLFNQQSRENTKELLLKLYENIILKGVKFDHVIFTTNVTWSDGNYNSDLVSLNNSKELVDKLTVQKDLAQSWSELDQANNSDSRKHIFPNIETSVNFIKSLTNDVSDVNVFVCGSLHLVGGFLVVLDNERD